MTGLNLLTGTEKPAGQIDKVVNLRIVLFLLVAECLFLGIVGYYFIRKYYMAYNMLRYDPLEDAMFRTDDLKLSGDLINIWMIGDSRIAQWDKDLLSSKDISIKNLGIDGQTSSQVLNRCRNYLKESHPDLVILEVGINDLKIIGLNKNLCKLVESKCYENITSALDLCREKKIKVVLLNIIPTGKIELLRRLVWNLSAYSSIVSLNNKLKQYCDDKDIFFYDTNNILCNEKLVIKDEYRNGFLHINENAYRAISKDMLMHIDLRTSKSIN